MQKADSILNFVDIPNFSVMDFESSLLLIKNFLYKKPLIVSTVVIHLKLQKIGKISRGIFTLGLVQSRETWNPLTRNIFLREF